MTKANLQRCILSVCPILYAYSE